MKQLFSSHSKNFHVPLRRVLIVPFVLQLCATVGVVGYLSFRTGQRAVQTLTSQLRTEVSARIQSELEGYFEIPHEINRLNAAALLEGTLDIANGSTGESQMYQQMRISPNIAFVYCGNREGDFFGVLRSPDDGSLQLSYSNLSTLRRRQYYAMNVLGKRTSFLREIDAYFNARRRPWYQDALRAERPTWTDVYLAFTTGLPNITASTPVYNRQGRSLIGVCATDVVLPEEFRSFLQTLEIGKSGQAFVVDRQGRLVSSSVEESATVTKVTGDADLLSAADSSNALVRGTTEYIAERFGGFGEIRRSQQLTFRLNGQRQFVQVLPFSDDKGLDWLIVVTIPEADFMGQIYSNIRNTFGLAILALGIAVGVGVLTTRWLTQPVLRLTEASREIADGKLSQQVDESIRVNELRTLAHSFNRMTSQLKTSFETLEDKVKERTADLAGANQQITRLNEKLKNENLRMSAELDAVRQIQQLILPRTEELDSVDGLDIAGFMEPADEVGGDYYDVLQANGLVTIGIGDVTGHGLESGMLMLMTQTVVRTLQQIQEDDPVKFLDTLNRTIYSNIQRMGTDKNLTLAVLNYEKGNVRISGQHEETLVVRADGRIEPIDTMDLGLPIGLDADISDFIDSTVVRLYPGDGLVLYTDGIPEAYSPQKEQYGMERFCKVILRCWPQSAEAIKQGIISDVRAFIGEQKVFDDITLLVIKQQ
ncbi:Stage II sporulation protein E [Synechococcus sp. PCC 7335]|uniref:SpoIIE family protein phosphatase n=1 Tax=Synechococcus sp. (strain ATCC 29403 / PCC 7335) TaxID=91464 RepID=UPI00017ECB71|nr:SpoIIE family protein phosphatase [Synechococcus sp. PCC 7335]EDX83223.1 Stage II sporulation protein E [Synechococcus sp. PCC 7335]